MKALKLKFYQPFTCYRKPLSFGVIDSYWLPPPSTVKGFVHSTAGVRKEFPLWVSIHGSVGGTSYELQKFKKFDKSRANQPKLKGFGGTLIPDGSPVFVETLTEVRLTIYLHFPEDSEELKEKFMDNLLISDFPSLGRKEDLALLEREPEEIEVEPYDPEELELFTKEWTFFSRETAKRLGLKGTYYRLGVSYDEEMKKKLGWRYYKLKDFLLAPGEQFVSEEGESLYADLTENRPLEMIFLESGYRHALRESLLPGG